MKRLFALLAFAVIGLPVLSFAKEKNARSFYEAIVYHYNSDVQGAAIGSYLEKVFVPAVHQLNMHAGVFSPIANDTARDKTVYVILEHSSMQSLLDSRAKLKEITGANADAKGFLGAPYNAPVYSRKEVMIMQAWPMATKLTEPKLQSPKAEHVYEWRSYESATDDLHVNKVHMFNEGGEVDLFARLNFNAIFYSSVIAGARMPNLIYMTSFENMKERDAHWKSFGDDPFWKKLVSSPEYQNNVSKADIILMKALPCSDY